MDTSFLDFLPVMKDILPWVAGVTIGLIVLLILKFFLRSSVSHKVRSIKDGPAMSMMDIDQMRKRGLVSEEEYRAIRHSLAGGEVERERRRLQAEREKTILAQVEKDPEAARLLLQTGQQETPAKPAPKAQPAPQRPQQAQPQPRPQQPQPRPQPQAQPGDPLAGVQPGDPLTHPTRIVQRPAAPQPQPQPALQPKNQTSELDLLLQQGVISPEQYQRLKASLKKVQ